MKKVAAIVVTYNRLELLKRCIAALWNQNYQDFDIVIVNNGSTDGTREWIEALKNVIVINQENCGGAGGFHTGQKYAYDNGYDWIWLMDDDGVAQPDQLKMLLYTAKKENSILLGALVCNIEDPSVLAFNVNRRVEGMADVLVNDEFRPFNGTLMHRSVVDKIGLIKREMFIWGDEMEFTFRAKKNGIIPLTVTRAIHLHPRNKAIVDILLPPLLNTKVVVKPDHFSQYYYRNLGYNNHLYSNRNVVIGNNLTYITYFLRKGRFNELFKFVKYYWKGYFNMFDER